MRQAVGYFEASEGVEEHPDTSRSVIRSDRPDQWDKGNWVLLVYSGSDLPFLSQTIDEQVIVRMEFKII
jgi:hypothetical protein